MILIINEISAINVRKQVTTQYFPDMKRTKKCYKSDPALHLGKCEWMLATHSLNYISRTVDHKKKINKTKPN